MKTKFLRRGFTLLETVLAVALLGALLLALNFFVFSMVEIWGGGAERRLFEQHVRAVTREVETLVRTAVLPPAAEPALFAREIRLADGRRDTLPSFTLVRGSPRLPWAETALPEVVCTLAAQPGSGLVLYWQSRLETVFEAAEPRPWVMTPWVTAMVYDYFESGNWRESPGLQRDRQGEWLLPARLRLRFEHNGLSAETSVLLPTTPVLLPHF